MSTMPQLAPPAWEQPLLNRQSLPEANTLQGFLAAGGFRGLAEARRLGPAGVIVRLRDAALRGRGPGARRVYEKWWGFRQRGGVGFLVADGRGADERGLAFQRLLARDPYGLVEGLAIAALATGAKVARLRFSPELKPFIPEVRDALEDARAAGVLEDLELMVQPYGEAPPTAAKPLELGHALETWYQVGLVLAMGPERYRGLGREGQAGTRLITVGGAVKRPGLVEARMGSTIMEVLEAAGGLTDPESTKALTLDDGVGGFLTPDLGGTVLAPEEMMEAKVSPGVSTLWAINFNHCIVDMARRAMTRALTLGLEETEASRQLTLNAIRLVTQIALRRGEPIQLEQLHEISRELMRQGAASAWTLASALAYFPGEWQTHLAGRSCVAFDRLMPLVAPCQASCPAGIDIPSFMALVAQGRHREAVRVIRMDNPLPYICGLVCPAPCEGNCLRGEQDHAVSIRAMKAVAAKHSLAAGGYPRPELAPATNKRAAVIGAGPAGLTCAYFLALAGHQVTIYEAGPVVGGTTYYGIPSYRLPRDIIRAEVEAITDLGVELKLNRALGKDFTLDGLHEQGFDAVFLGMGALKGMRLGLEGEELEGVQSGVDFLRMSALGKAECPGRRVAVVGGGNVAMDAARSALRLGSEEVTVIYRRTAAEMPAFEHEVHEAMEEGINFRFLTNPVRFVGQDGRLMAVKVIRMRLGEPDASGRRRPVPIKGSEEMMPMEGVLSAIGQHPDVGCLDADCGIEVARASRLVADPVTMQTGLEWVFAGGDAVTGPATVVDAVAAGKRAAAAMDRYLLGQTMELALKAARPRAHVEPIPATPAARANPERAEMPMRSPDKRRQDFDQVELGFNEQQAWETAARCLRCDLCLGCGLCQTACAEMGAEALKFGQGEDRLYFADFMRPAHNCAGCGACANACPTGALKMVDEGGKRKIVMTGTMLKASDLVPCSVCGRPYASQVQLNQVSRRLEDRLHQRVDEHICPDCARQQQVRDHWAKRFLARGGVQPKGPDSGLQA